MAAHTSEMYASLERGLQDPKQEVRRRAQSNWEQHVKDITGQNTTDGNKSVAAALRWVHERYLRSATKESRKQGISLLKEFFRLKNALFSLSEDNTNFVVDRVLAMLRDQSDEVRLQALDMPKQFFMVVKQAVYLRFEDIAQQLLRLVPPGDIAEAHQQRPHRELVELTRTVFGVVEHQLKGAAGLAPGAAAPPFNMDEFIRVVRFGLGDDFAANPAVSHFLVEHFLKTLAGFSNANLLSYLHLFLGDLFRLLRSDGTRRVVRPYLDLLHQEVRRQLERGEADALERGDGVVDCVSCMKSVLANMEPAPAHTSLQWMLLLAGNGTSEAEVSLLSSVSDIVDRTVPLCRDGAKQAGELNDVVATLVERYGQTAVAQSIDFASILRTATKRLDDVAIRKPLLLWVSLVHGCCPAVVEDSLQELNAALVRCLDDTDEHVVRRALEVLAIVAERDEARWLRFLEMLLFALSERDAPTLLVCRIPMVFKELQVQAALYDFPADFVFCNVGALLNVHRDKHFVCRCVATLSLMLITAPEFGDLRTILRSAVSKEPGSTFQRLFACWRHSAVWAIALCCLAREYDEAYSAVRYIAERDVSAHVLVQLDRLLQLFETPAFTFLRLTLTDPRGAPYLIRTLYAILMVLPQSSAQYSVLENRLAAAARLQSALVGTHVAHLTLVEEPATPLHPLFVEAQRDLEAWEGTN